MIDTDIFYGILSVRIDPLNPKIKIWNVFCWSYSFPTDIVGEVDKISSKFILCDPCP